MIYYKDEKKIGTQETLPNNATEITNEQYKSLKNVLDGIPNKDGFVKDVTLNLDGTYKVRYVPIDTEED